MRVLTAILLMTTAAVAFDGPPPLSEEQKIEILKEAYRLNGNSMVRWGSIDMTGFFKEGAEARVVKTVPIMPITSEFEKNELDEQADVDKLQKKWVRLRGDKNLANNVCEEYGMRKVTTGDSWRCRK